MYQSAILLLAVVACHTTLAQIAPNPYINPYQTGTDGKARYSTPLYCSYGSLLYSQTYNTDRSTYTERNDVDCCYYADTRNVCCMDTVSNNGVIYQSCRCSPTVTCGLATTMPPTTTPPPTTTVPTTTPVPTTTMTMPITTTTIPTTTTTLPTTTTTIPTTTTTMPTTTTTMMTTTPPSLCASPTVRILNGVKADTCTYPGVANITAQGGQISSCNAVLVPATVNGVTKLTFLTAKICKDIVQKVTTTTFELQIGKQIIAIQSPTFALYDGPDGTAFIDLDDRYMHLIDDIGCQLPACGYDSATMDGRVDFTTCKILSYGASDPNTFSQNGLNEVDVTENPGGCTTLPDTYGAANTYCFKSVSGKNIPCSGDSGAPVYCLAPENGEYILVGVTAFHQTCNQGNEMKVLPYPM